MNIERATAISLKKIPEKVKNLENIFFKQMAVAHSIFTLGGWDQLFWTAFDPMFTVVPLKVALVCHKFDFWAFKNIIRQVYVKCHIMIIFLKCPKIKFVPS